MISAIPVTPARQHVPVPLPASGAIDVVSSPTDTVFDWTYGGARSRLLGLYEKGKSLAWNASDLDWSIDVDAERMVHEMVGATTPDLFNQLLQPPHPLTPREAVEMQLNMTAWMVSQFLHGEQGALLATAKIVQAVPMQEAKWYAANQVADEARHVEVYHRYLTEKLGRSFPVNPQLRVLLDQILADSRWDMTYLGMQILVEGMALAAFGVLRFQLPTEPLIQEITARIMADEARHVAFGVLSLESFYAEMTDAERREREEFVITASALMRDRLLMDEVYERMGWHPPTWVRWAMDTPFMAGFRQMLFAKIVPNLRRLGLLTPRVRAAYAQLGILEYEHERDSTEDPEPPPPTELLNLLSRLREGA